MKLKKGNIHYSRIFSVSKGREKDDLQFEYVCAIIEDTGLFTVFRLKTKAYFVWNDEETESIHPVFIIGEEYSILKSKLEWSEGYPGQKIRLGGYEILLVK